MGPGEEPTFNVRGDMDTYMEKKAIQMAERTTKGALHLDQVMAGWHKNINVDEFLMSEPDECIVFQLTGRDMFEEGLAALDVKNEDAGFLGFDLDVMETAKGREVSESEEGMLWQMLTNAWLDRIRERTP